MKTTLEKIMNPVVNKRSINRERKAGFNSAKAHIAEKGIENAKAYLTTKKVDARFDPPLIVAYWEGFADALSENPEG